MWAQYPEYPSSRGLVGIQTFSSSSSSTGKLHHPPWPKHYIWPTVVFASAVPAEKRCVDMLFTEPAPVLMFCPLISGCRIVSVVAGLRIMWSGNKPGWCVPFTQAWMNSPGLFFICYSLKTEFYNTQQNVCTTTHNQEVEPLKTTDWILTMCLSLTAARDEEKFQATRTLFDSNTFCLQKKKEILILIVTVLNITQKSVGLMQGHKHVCGHEVFTHACTFHISPL